MLRYFKIITNKTTQIQCLAALN